MVGCAKMGINFTACAPKELFPNDELVKKAKEIAKENGCTVTLTEDIKTGTKNANIVYTDIWVSMGEPEGVWEERIKLLKPYQVNTNVMNGCAENVIFMHCLPSYHDTNTIVGREISEKFGINEMEVTTEVFESKRSVVFDEAENRMHTIKAVIYATIG
jgi:ornithine carbamoyltransferase